MRQRRLVGLCLVPLCLAVPASTLENLPAETGIDPEQAALKRKPGKDFCVFFLTGLMTVVLTYVLQAPALIAKQHAGD